MEIGSEGLIIITLTIIGFYFIYNIQNERGLIKVKSNVDNEEYTVQLKDDSKEAADLIAHIKKKLILLLEHMQRTFGKDDKRVIQLTNNFKPNNIKEGVSKPGYTSYSINKGEQIVLCLRNKGSDELVDMNTMMFVVLHEFAHLASVSIGHTEEFWDNFRILLRNAIKLKIYKRVNYNEKPVKYCGVEITDDPMNFE